MQLSWKGYNVQTRTDPDPCISVLSIGPKRAVEGLNHRNSKTLPRCLALWWVFVIIVLFPSELFSHSIKLPSRRDISIVGKRWVLREKFVQSVCVLHLQ